MITARPMATAMLHRSRRRSLAIERRHELHRAPPSGATETSRGGAGCSAGDERGCETLCALVVAFGGGAAAIPEALKRSGQLREAGLARIFRGDEGKVFARACGRGRPATAVAIPGAKLRPSTQSESPRATARRRLRGGRLQATVASRARRGRRGRAGQIRASTERASGVQAEAASRPALRKQRG